jgi:hypothetical protein
LKFACPVAILIVAYIVTPPPHPSPKYNPLKEKVNFSLNNIKAHRGIGVLFPLICNLDTR